MRALSVVLTLLLSLPVLADDYLQLYQAAGWPQQRMHFSDALQAAQERYRGSLPPAVHQALVNITNAALFGKEFLPAMRAEPGNRNFVFIASVNALSHFGNPAYSAAKAAGMA